jgi:hypothetical protein
MLLGGAALQRCDKDYRLNNREGHGFSRAKINAVPKPTAAGSFASRMILPLKKAPIGAIISTRALRALFFVRAGQ